MTKQNPEENTDSEIDYTDENPILTFLLGLIGTWASFKLFIKNCFSFEGRTSRYDFWAPLLFSVAIFVLLASCEDVSGKCPLFCFFFFMIPPILSGGVCRFHDIGKSKRYFFTLTAAIYILYLAYDNADTSTATGVAFSTLSTVTGFSCMIRLFYLLLKSGSRTDNIYGKALPPETKEQYVILFAAVIIPGTIAFGFYPVAFYNNLVAYFSL